MIPGRPIVRHTQRVRDVVLNACRITWFKVSDSQRLAGWGLQATPGGNIRRKSVRPVRPSVRRPCRPSPLPGRGRAATSWMGSQHRRGSGHLPPSLPPSLLPTGPGGASAPRRGKTPPTHTLPLHLHLRSSCEAGRRKGRK